MLLGICMTEPGTGSDLANVQTRAVRDGDHYVLNGAKTFISLGQLGDLFIVVARPIRGEAAARGHQPDPRRGGHPGFVRGRKLEKLGLPAQDTSELSSRTAASRSRTSSARGQGLQDADGEAAAGAHLHRRLGDRVLPARARRHHRLREAAARLRAADRAFQNTQFKLAELATAGGDRPGVRRPAAAPRTCAATTSSWSVDGQVVDDRTCRSGSPPSACSSTAATAS
jgi:long-chain-acyl-CoA dehydrogenase